MKLYNYFACATENGGSGRVLYATVYRVPLGDSCFSPDAEAYAGRNQWVPRPFYSGLQNRPLVGKAKQFKKLATAQKTMRRMALKEQGAK